MEIILKRKPSTERATIGELFINGSHECYTCEDPVRDIKIDGKTAIPAGKYKVVINRSNRFSKIAGYDVFLPHILDVPGFEGIRIHSGNTPEDTEGCLLVGQAIGMDNESVIYSKLAMQALQPKIQDALNLSEEVWITIERAT